jgi:N-formylglutamate amidohydrolase
LTDQVRVAKVKVMEAVEILWAADVAELAPAFEILRPDAGPPTPLIFASPHSGRLYPRSMMAASSLDADAIRRSEDVLVDDLIAPGARAGAVVIQARFARAFMDVNRGAYELDPAMFEDELPAFARGRSARVAAGLGAIARIVAEGQEIYARKLTFAEASHRIEAVHRPYHAALADLISEARAAHSLAVLIDWHSMPSAAAGYSNGRRNDIVLGDRFGASASPHIARLVELSLRDAGYRVARNVPYAGGYTTEHYGRPASGVHALQIEIDRGLYLNETTLKPARGYDKVKADLARIFTRLAKADWARLV